MICQATFALRITVIAHFLISGVNGQIRIGANLIKSDHFGSFWIKWINQVSAALVFSALAGRRYYLRDFKKWKFKIPARRGTFTIKNLLFTVNADFYSKS
jgi:hypothetical protein